MNARRLAALNEDRLVPNDEMPFEAAARRNFPAFLTPVALSNPANATPYLVGRAGFCSIARRWPGRARLVDALEQAIAEADDRGAEIVALLIGGSFTDLRNPAPRDLDAVAFYRAADPAAAVDARGLAELQKRARAAGADLRFMPVDGNPIVLIRSIAYFTRLYSEARPDAGQAGRPPRGLILVDCAAAAATSLSIEAGDAGSANAGSKR